jgi:outer membrane protein OmpA-like peptidoglycan-associated protein
MKTGRSLREYAGTSDLWVSLEWDGRDAEGNAVPAGEYQAFLSAATFGGNQATDTLPLVVKRGPRAATAPLASSTSKNASVREETPARRQWAQVVRFAFNHSDLSGAGRLDLRQLAANIQAFPRETVVIEGDADSAEVDARNLAESRARRVKEELIAGFGIPPERLSARGREPRRAADGEALQKAVAFFVEGGR